MNIIRMRRCGLGWAYCNGDCKDCAYTNMITTSYTGRYDYEEVYGIETTTDGKTRWSGVYSGEHKE